MLICTSVKGSPPTADWHDCASTKEGNSEACILDAKDGGNFYIMVLGKSDF